MTSLTSQVWDGRMLGMAPARREKAASWDSTADPLAVLATDPADGGLDVLPSHSAGIFNLKPGANAPGLAVNLGKPQIAASFERSAS